MSGGSEVRRDPWSGAESIVAPGRLVIGGVRPGGLPEPSTRCPFCPGHEAETEATVAAYGEPWRVRVVLNRFPLVSDAMPAARGRHEVVIETREHDVDLPDLDDARLAEILRAYRDRARALGTSPGIAAVVLFRNRGRRAGSSQPHPHAQAVALDYVPPALRARDAIAAADPELFERTIEHERRGGRVIAEHDGFVTFAPYASARAHEVRITPSRRVERLALLGDGELAALATHLGAALRALRARMGLADYNLLFRDPAIGATAGFFSLEILPRTGGDAGFELHTGSSICLVAPEETAAALRGLLGDGR